MTPRLLLDTHILIRWLGNLRKLSREQLRALENAVRRGEPLGISAISLVEVALLSSGRDAVLKAPLREFIEDMDSNPAFRILPITGEVALEAAVLGSLRDSADRVIAATARVHRLKLVTSDQRIIESRLVAVVE